MSKSIPLGEAGSQPLSFRRVVYRIPTNARIGQVRVGHLKTEEMRWTLSRTDSQSFNVAVTDGLRRLGYDVRDEADSLFEPKSGEKIRFEMAAILHDAEVDFDYKLNRNRDGAGQGVGRAEVDVEVRLFDTRSRETVYENRFIGRASDEGTRPNPLMGAIVDAILQTTEDPRFVSLLAFDPAAAGLASGTSEAPRRVSACHAEGALALPADLPGTLAAVVEIEAGNVGGTGVVVSPDGWLLTAAHVVRDAPEVWVRIGGGALLPATVHASDAEIDLALLRIPGREHDCARVRLAPGRLDLGSDVFAVNRPIGERGRPTVSRGVVSGFPVRDGQRFIQTDASINPGSSGGPLLAEDGTVAGFTVLKIVGPAVDGLGLAVPAPEAIRRLSIDFRDVGR